MSCAERTLSSRVTLRTTTAGSTPTIGVSGTAASGSESAMVSRKHSQLFTPATCSHQTPTRIHPKRSGRMAKHFDGHSSFASMPMIKAPSSTCIGSRWYFGSRWCFRLDETFGSPLGLSPTSLVTSQWKMPPPPTDLSPSAVHGDSGSEVPWPLWPICFYFEFEFVTSVNTPSGPVHTGCRANRNIAHDAFNGHHCCKWECSHRLQATLKNPPTHLSRNLLMCPVWMHGAVVQAERHEPAHWKPDWLSPSRLTTEVF